MTWLKDILFEAIKKLSRWQIFVLVFSGIILYFGTQLYKSWTTVEIARATRSVPENGISEGKIMPAGIGIDRKEIKEIAKRIN